MEKYILVELDPTITHNSTFGYKSREPLSKTHHREKTEAAAKQGMHCIHIFDWDDQEKIVSFFKKKISIYARKCKIKEIEDTEEYQAFINENHFQGYCKGNKIIVGLYYNDELVEIMSFGKPRYNKKYEYELLRLCTSMKYKVIGGASRIFEYFKNKYSPKSIISYCDMSKFSGDVYLELGFTLYRKNQPSKHWYNITTGQHITDNLLRQRGFDQLFDADYGKGTSNEELMISNGFLEVYDCGQATYIWKKE